MSAALKLTTPSWTTDGKLVGGLVELYVACALGSAKALSLFAAGRSFARAESAARQLTHEADKERARILIADALSAIDVLDTKACRLLDRGGR